MRDSVDHFREPSMRIVQRVADAAGVAPEELPPLYESIDADALDRLLERGDGVTVQIRYYGHHVRVTADGGVTVSEMPAPP